MKKYQIYLLMLFICIGMGTTGLYGQQNLENWVKKCEKNESIDMTYISSKDPKTKKETRKSIQIKFKDNDSLRKELVDAFNKDKDKAFKVSMQRTNGVTGPGFCHFKVGNNQIRYTFEYNKRKETIVNVQYLYGVTDWDG